MAWGWRGRGRGWAGPWPGRGPFSYLPPWQRPGWLFGGFGRGFGGRLWGFGRGFGGWGYPYNPWVCARFPWLPRWWWANPAYTYGGFPWSIYGTPGYAYPYTAYQTYPRYPPAPYMSYW